MTAAPTSPFDRLVQTIQDGRLFALLGTPQPELTALDRQQLQFNLQGVHEDLAIDPDRLVATMRAKLGIDAEVKLHCVNWHDDFSEHSIVIGSSDPTQPGWSLMLKSTVPDVDNVRAWAWLCLFEGPKAAQLMCESVEQDALMLTAFRMERALGATTLPLSFERCVALRGMLAESDLGQHLLSAWDAHVRGAALEEALPVQPIPPKRPRL